MLASVCVSWRLTAANSFTKKHNNYATHFTTKIMCNSKNIMHSKSVTKTVIRGTFVLMKVQITF